MCIGTVIEIYHINIDQTYPPLSAIIPNKYDSIALSLINPTAATAFTIDDNSTGQIKMQALIDISNLHRYCVYFAFVIQTLQPCNFETSKLHTQMPLFQCQYKLIVNSEWICSTFIVNSQ